MISYDKSEIRDSLTIENIFELLQEWGGDPEYTSFGILSSTICHNMPGEGSKKLYYYENSDLFKCYTGCDSSFDIFELAIKVAAIQSNKQMDLNDAVRWVAFKFGMIGSYVEEQENLALSDWKIISDYEKLQDIEIKNYDIILKEYDSSVLNNFNYKVKIKPWLDEDITQQVLNHARIGFFAGGDQITIPHYDQNGRLVGLRGRTLCAEEAEKYGKYRPLKINKDWYNHPLGMNLYNLNNSKDNIKTMKKAIVFESE